MSALKVGDVMTHLVVTLRPQDSISDAAQRLLRNRISGAPVVEDRKLVGVISEADLMAVYTAPAPNRMGFAGPDPLAYLLSGRLPIQSQGVTVGDMMTKKVVSVSAEASVRQAARLIDRYGIRRLPVVDSDNYVVGVLARSDLVRALARGDEDIKGDVLTAVVALGEENFADLEVEASDGEVTIGGTADRRSTHDLAVSAAAGVSGVLSVVDELGWRWDDGDVRPARNPRDASEIGRDPWAVGPLMKEGVG